MFRSITTDQSGFTLVEALVVTGILVILFAVGAVNLGQPQTNARSISAVDTLVNDLKSQQIAAMAGATGSTAAQQAAGIFVQSNQYTLFNGASFSAGNSYNYMFTPAIGVAFGTTFPGGIILFTKGAGELSGFTAGNNTITVTAGGVSKVITISRFGAVTVT
ncbi:type II secretion system protein [Aeromicrobium sp.]|nr:type II secretion system protein [Candidatus Saccharibacteria bacterium]